MGLKRMNLQFQARLRRGSGGSENGEEMTKGMADQEGIYIDRDKEGRETGVIWFTDLSPRCQVSGEKMRKKDRKSVV